MMKLLIRRIDPAAQLPTYAHPGDAGMDVRSIEALTLAAGEWACVRTGLVFQLPPDVEVQIRPRSGLALRHGVTVLNAPGTIDSGYRGEVGVILVNHGHVPFHVERGMRIAQIVVSRVESVEVEEIEVTDETARGAAGFGSSGT